MLTRYNARITGDSASDSGDPATSPSASDVRQVSLAKAPLSPLSGPLQGLGYLHTPGTEDDLKPVTHWVAADLASQVGSITRNATQHHQNTHNHLGPCKVISKHARV